QMDTGRREEARADFDQAIALLKSAQGDRARHELARCHINRGILHREDGQPTPAEADYQQAIVLLRRLDAGPRPRPLYRFELGVTCNNLANLLAEASGRRQEALTAHEDALRLLKGHSENFPTQPHPRRELANAHNSVGRTLYSKDNPAATAKHW